jgi:hypothetical protein
MAPGGGKEGEMKMRGEKLGEGSLLLSLIINKTS